MTKTSKPTRTKRPRLRHKVTVEKRQRTSDGAGGWSEAWVEVATFHAERKPLKGQERFLGQQVYPGLSYRYLTRYREDVKPQDMRLTEGGVTYDIVAVYDPDGERRWLTIEVAEGVR